MIAPSKPGPSFQVSSIAFEGNKVVLTRELVSLAKPYVGGRQTLAALRTLTETIQALYRSRGYFLARAVLPAQELTSGHIRIVILEGNFGETKIDGNKHYSKRFIDRFFSPARRSGVIQEGPVTRALLVLNEFQDLHVQSVLKRGTKPGTTDVILKVTDQSPWHVAVDYNNYGNRLVGQNRAGLGVTGGSVVTDGDDLVLRITEPFPTKGEPFYQAGYSAPIGRRGGRLGYQYAQAKTRVGGELAPLDIRGNAFTHGLMWARPLTRTLSRSTNFSAGFHVKSIENFVFKDTTTSKDELREITLGWGGNVNDPKKRFFHNSVVTQGLGTAFGGDANDHALPSRLNTGNQFTKVNSDLIHVRQFTPEDVAIVRVGFQLSTKALPTAEQFGIGGPDSVRGFIQSEFLGDRGYSIGAEYNRTVIEKKKFRLQLATFIERGEASLIEPGPGERGSKHLAGAGGGLRAQVGRGTSIKLDLGFPISQDRNVENEDVVLYAQAASRF